MRTWLVLLVLLAPGCGGEASETRARADGRVSASLHAADLPEHLQVRSYAFSDAARASLKGASDEAPRSGGTITIVYPTDPRTLNNLLRRTAIETNILRTYLFPPLLDVDAQTLELVPELAATRPTVSEDHLTWRWTLRPGVFWHRARSDGAPVEVTCEDVKFSWDMLWNEKVDAAQHRAALSRYEDLRVLDRYTFEVRLSEPYYKAEMEFGYNFPLVPAHLSVRDPETFHEDPLGRAPVGYGPFRFDQWQQGSHLTLVRNPGYWDHTRRPFHVERLRFVFARDSEQVMTLFRRGEVDVAAIQNAAQFEAAKDDPELREKATFHEYFLPTWNYIVWNERHPAFRDARVRRAMTLLYPREIVRDRFYRGHAAVVSGPWAVTGREYDHSVEPLPFDPLAAAALLDEAGLVDTDGDGIREVDGRPLRFSLLRPSTKNANLEAGNLLFQQELRKVGVLLDLQPVEFAALLESLGESRFDACQLGFKTDPRDEDLYPVLHSTGGAYNYGHYASAECDALLEAYRNEFDEDRRRAIAHSIHRRVHADQPVTFLHAPQSIVMVSSRLRGVNIRRLGSRVCDWWVPAP